MAFKSITEYNEERYGGYLLLPDDGDFVDVIFLYQKPEDMVVCDAHYIKSAEYTGYVQCPGVGCPACKDKIRVQTKLFIPCYNVNTKEILFFDRNIRFSSEFNNQVFRATPNPSEYVYRITRHGAARSMDTTYSMQVIGKNSVMPYDVILATNHITFPEYYGTICKEVSISELAQMLNNSDGSSASGMQAAYNVSSVPAYQVTPRVPANANPIPEYVPPQISTPVVTPDSDAVGIPDGLEGYNLEGDPADESDEVQF